MSSTGNKRHHAAAEVELVLFDYGQVLSTPPDPAAWGRMLTITGLPGDKLHKAYWALRHDYDRGTLNGPDYWYAVAKHVDVSFSHTQIEALLTADVDLWAQPNPPMIAWSAQLQRAGVRTAILSNIGDAMAVGLSARLPWLQSFERCIWSYAVRMAKPEPEIFRATVEMLHLEPDRILFIDDKHENVAAAQSLGMKAIRYPGHANFERSIQDSEFARLWTIQT